MLGWCPEPERPKATPTARRLTQVEPSMTKWSTTSMSRSRLAAIAVAVRWLESGEGVGSWHVKSVVQAATEPPTTLADDLGPVRDGRFPHFWSQCRTQGQGHGSVPTRS